MIRFMGEVEDVRGSEEMPHDDLDVLIHEGGAREEREAGANTTRGKDQHREAHKEEAPQLAHHEAPHT